jgi:hypothetical protein
LQVAGGDLIFYKRDGGGFDPSGQSLSTGASSLSSIAVSGDNIHVVFVTSSGTLLYTRSLNGGGSFATPLAVIGGASNPSIAVSGNDVHIVWETNAGNEIFYIRSTTGGVSFGAPINLSNSAGSSVLSSIAASGSNVFVVWREDISGNNEILYRRSTDGGASFEPTINLSNNVGSSLFASIAASGDNVYVVWGDNSSGLQILYRRSTDGGASFEPTVNLSNSLSSGVNGASVAARGDNVYVVWHEFTGGSNEIIDKRSIDGGASFDVTATNLSNNFGNSRDAHVAVS